MAFELIPFSSDTALAQAAAAEWTGKLKSALGGSASYTVALSGGRIAKLFCTEVAKCILQWPDPEKQIFDRQVHFFWADERCVPPTDPESNYAIARQLLFEPLKLPGSQIHRLRGEDAEHVALHDAVKNITRRARVMNGVPVFDIIFLGMGEDGHVASLFPGESEMVMNDPSVYRAVTAMKPPPRRISLGYSTLAAAKEVWMLASGAGKEAALKNSLSPNGQTPFARVLKLRSQTRILTDIAR